MKKFNTLEELKEALMSEDGAVYRVGRVLSRFRIKYHELERYSVTGWLEVSTEYDHWFIFDLENWTRYEKPKKIVKEEIKGFVHKEDFKSYQSNPFQGVITFIDDKRSGVLSSTVFKATLTIEREVEGE